MTIIKYIKNKSFKKRSIYILFISILLCILLGVKNQNTSIIKNHSIMRTGYGEKKTPYKINVDIDDEKNIEIDFSVSSRRYKKSEIDRIFDEKYDELLITVLGENNDFDNIIYDLNFQTDVSSGIKAIWNFKPENENNDFNYYLKYQNVIDSRGNVRNKDFLYDEFVKGYISLILYANIKEEEGVYKSSEYIIPITIKKGKVNKRYELKSQLLKDIDKNDRDTIENESMLLPDKVNGKNVKYKEKKDNIFLIIPFLGILLIVLFEYRDKNKIKTEKLNLEKSIEKDFCIVATKILLYINSGMSIRNGLIKIANDYLNKLKNNKIKNSFVNDEIVLFKNKVLSGIGEIEALDYMAKHINMRIWTRFINTLEQSIKNGNKDIKNILNMEVQDALFEKKYRAKRLGEEASTKLILPLMLNLAVIMIIIMVPAFMSI